MNTRKLLNQLCVKYGYCLANDSQNEIVALEPNNEEDFVRLVIEKEGLTIEEIGLKSFREMKDFVRSESNR